MIPPLLNDFIGLQKDTALVSVLGSIEAVRAAQIYGASQFNYASYVGHSAIRTFVMGERAFDGAATEDDLKAMEHHVRDAIRAGAAGFTSSRSPSHETPEGRPVASRQAEWSEVRRLVNAMGELNAGLFEVAGEGVDRNAGDPGVRDWHTRLRDLAVESGRPITFGVFSRRGSPEPGSATRPLDETAAMADACSRRRTAGRFRR